MNNSVISYFQPIAHPQLSNDSFNLLEKWKSNWQSQGWNPIILNEEYATKNPFYSKIDLNNSNNLLFYNRCKNNPIDYLRQCFMRWLAYTRFVFENGPTVWCDYDVYNKSLTYTKHKTLPQVSQTYCGSGSVGLMNDRYGNLILNTFKDVSKSNDIQNIKNFTPEAQKHIDMNANALSDMHLVQTVFFEPPAQITRLCTCFYDPPSLNVKSFDLFHIHGGVADPLNKNKLSINFPYHLNLTRREQWDYIVNLLK